MNSETIVKKKLPGWFRALRWLAGGVVVLMTLVALVYAVENFRGKRAWEAYRKDARQRGLVLDFAALIPPPVPDDQNGASIPLIESWFDPRLRPNGDPTLWPDLHKRADEMLAIDRDKTKRRLIDLVTWQQALAAAEAGEQPKGKLRFQSRTPQERASAATNVLAALIVYEPALEQLRQGMKRPHVRYPVDYNTEQPFSILLPHLQNVKPICRVLGLRASANLALGQSDAAAQDVLLSLRFVESLREEHFLISYLVRVAGFQLVTHAIWEGMVQQRWTDAQLKAIQEQVTRMDFLQGLQRALETERAACISTMDWIKQRDSAKRFQALGEPQANLGEKGPILMTLMPRGWWELEKVNYVKLFDSDAGPLSATLKNGSFAQAQDATAAQRRLRGGIAAVWHHQMMAALLLPALDKVQRKAAMAQSFANEIVVACAVDRARLASGSYPQSLTGLTPKFLSQEHRDIMTGEPLIYRTEGTGYILYSVGWNRVDDGGAPGKVLMDEQHGDWTWRVQPQASAEFE